MNLKIVDLLIFKPNELGKLTTPIDKTLGSNYIL